MKWPKYARCKCAGCGEFFCGVSTFDKHQEGIFPVICLPPADVGLIDNGHGAWMFPKEPEIAPNSDL